PLKGSNKFLRGTPGLSHRLPPAYKDNPAGSEIPAGDLRKVPFGKTTVWDRVNNGCGAGLESGLTTGPRTFFLLYWRFEPQAQESQPCPGPRSRCRPCTVTTPVRSGGARARFAPTTCLLRVPISAT